jgi:hypothetical protein
MIDKALDFKHSIDVVIQKLSSEIVELSDKVEDLRNKKYYEEDKVFTKEDQKDFDRLIDLLGSLESAKDYLIGATIEFGNVVGHCIK